MTAKTSPAFQLRGVHVLAMVVGFFAVIIAVDSSFAVLAYRTFPGQVSVTPYEDGVAYNRTLAELAAQEALGWRAAASFGPNGEVVIEARSREGAPVRGLAAVGRMERPATEAGRIVPVFRESGPGIYTSRPVGMGGVWDLTVALTDKAGHAFQAERRLTWP